MPRAAERDDARLGRWAIGVVLVAAAAVIVTPTIRERSRREFRLVVPSGADLHGVSLNSKVRIGGITSGRVVQINPLIDDRPLWEMQRDGLPGANPNSRITGTELRLAIDRGIRFFPGTSAAIEREMVSGLAWISIPSLGEGGDGAKPLRPGDEIRLLPNDNPIGELLAQQDGEGRFDWMTAAFEDVRTGWSDAERDAATLVEEVRTSWAPLELRASEVAARYETIGQRIDGLFDDIARLRDEFNAIEGEGEPLYEAIRGDLSELSEASVRIGDRLDVTFPRTRDAMSREFERLVSGLHAIELRLGSLELGRNWNELLADFSLAGGQLGRTLGDVAANPLRLIRNESRADRIQERFDRMGRELLMALDEARAAEASLRLIGTAGSVPADVLPRLTESMNRIGELLDAAARIERAYRQIRIDSIPVQPAPAP